MSKGVNLCYLTDEEWVDRVAGGGGGLPILGALRIRGGYVVLSSAAAPESPTSAAGGESKATASTAGSPAASPGPHGGPRGRG